MSESLFRKEVMAARQHGWLGSVRIQPPRLGWFFLALGMLTVLMILIIMTEAHYTRHQQVEGSLVPAEGLLTLAPTAPGIVTRVLVREGDAVSAGQPLLEISGEQVSASLGDTHAAITADLDIKRERLSADLREQKNLAELQAKDLRERQALLRDQITQIDQQIALQSQRADSASSLYEQWSKAEGSGVVSKWQVLQQKDVALQNQVALKQLTEKIFQLKQQDQQLRGQLEQLPAAMSGKANDIARQLADVAQLASQNEVQRALVLRAPFSGTVANVIVHPGQAVAAQQSLMIVLPANSKLLAELWVPTRAIGFVREGGRVVIRYQAYPYQKFGQYAGHITGVSRSALSATEATRLLGREVKESRYRVLVALDSQAVMAYGHAEILKPGMTLDADVQVDRRRLIEWITEPLRGGHDSVVTTQGAL
ncbi:HlyD family secretion protein [Dyella terrae]|uniref:HlyD family secretion protein n=1 Tax=Dyella terrae TaxID=522259 RepID=UPI001EFE2CAE|nr:HlyD family efflux transporter periplasmic adaptor subunit [Dyella terrae]ULU25287.1 HlyD family efflux transporter periplasmic adaptor subunit [Dyella terrae]